MVDPNDFVDQGTPEGEESINPKAGQEGVGGLSTEDANDSYKSAAKQHFTDDTKKSNDKKNNLRNKDEHEKNKEPTPHPLPQIGSLEDDEIKVED